MKTTWQIVKNMQTNNIHKNLVNNLISKFWKFGPANFKKLVYLKSGPAN